MKFYTSLFFAAIVGSGYYAVAQKQLEDIPTTAVNAGLFKTLVSALDAADLVDTLSGDDSGPYTVFAPSDIAFAKLSKSYLQCLLEPENKRSLTELLSYHVADGKVLSSELTDGQIVQTLNDGQTVQVSIQQCGWLDWLFPGTSKTAVKINDSTVTIPDIEATNGVIHVINTVLIPQGFKACQKDIPTVASEAGVFKTLVAALEAADLVDALSGDNGPYTVFAPTDYAFNKLPSDLVECLLEPENKDTLTQLLLYHVADGKLLSTDLSDRQTIPTLSDGGRKIIEIDFVEKGWSFWKYTTVVINDNAKISIKDVEARNGVIHIINSVLVPDDFVGCASTTTDFSMRLRQNKSKL